MSIQHLNFMMLLIYFALTHVLAQNTPTSNDCPSGYQALSADPNETCSNDFRFSKICIPSAPCEVESCAEFCDELSECTWFFSNSKKACHLFTSCDEKRFSSFEGVTCQKSEVTNVPTETSTDGPTLEPTLQPTNEPTTDSITGECRIRRSWMFMDAAEREHFINVYKQVSQTEKFREFTTMHYNKFNPIHEHEQFLAWHRYYLWVVENWLREFDPEITIPFWAWEEDAGEDWLWTNDNELWGPEPYAFGTIKSESGKYEVDDGPFACDSWKLGNDECLTRQQPKGKNRVPHDEVWLQSVISDTSLSHEGFREAINTPHGDMHCMIGGSMCHPSTSAYTPDFLLHHSNVDRFWDLWQKHSPENRAKESTQTGPMNGQFEGHTYAANDFNDPDDQPDGVCVIYEGTGNQNGRRVLSGDLEPKRFVTNMVHNFPDNQAFYHDLLHLHALPVEPALTFKANGMMEQAKQNGGVLTQDQAMSLARKQLERNSGIHDSVKVVPGDYKAPSVAAEFFTKRSGVTMESVRSAFIKHGYVAKATQFEKDLQTLAEALEKERENVPKRNRLLRLVL